MYSHFQRYILQWDTGVLFPMHKYGVNMSYLSQHLYSLSCTGSFWKQSMQENLQHDLAHFKGCLAHRWKVTLSLVICCPERMISKSSTISATSSIHPLPFQLHQAHIHYHFSYIKHTSTTILTWGKQSLPWMVLSRSLKDLLPFSPQKLNWWAKGVAQRVPRMALMWGFTFRPPTDARHKTWSQKDTCTEQYITSNVFITSLTIHHTKRNLETTRKGTYTQQTMIKSF